MSWTKYSLGHIQLACLCNLRVKLTQSDMGESNDCSDNGCHLKAQDLSGFIFFSIKFVTNDKTVYHARTLSNCLWSRVGKGVHRPGPERGGSISGPGKTLELADCCIIKFVSCILC